MAVLIDEGLELLDEPDCLALLAHSSIGRLGVSVGGLPAIFPVNFVFADGSVVFHTGEGTKLSAAVANTVVAFQCDEFDLVEQSGWSVLVVGPAEVVTDPTTKARLERLPLANWLGGRDHYVRVRVDFVSGRRIVRGPSGEDPAS